MDAVKEEVKIGMGRREMRFLEERGEWRLSDILMTLFCMVSWRRTRE